MLCTRGWSLFMVIGLCSMFIPETAQQHHPLPLADQSFTRRQGFTESKTWQQSLLNRSDSEAAYLDPILSSFPDGTTKNDIPRQLFNSKSHNAAFTQSRASGYQQPPFAGFQQNPNPGYQQFSKQGSQQYPDHAGFIQFPNSGFQQIPNPAFQQQYKSSFPENPNPGFQQFPNPDSQEPPSSASPQIYKMDNLVIIANPQPTQQRPCVSDRLPPPKFPNPDRSGTKKPGEDEHNCVWAVITCCSPKEFIDRHNCFELLGCSGSLFDSPPCDPDKILAAADKAVEYYNNEYNRTTSAATDNSV